MLAEAKGSAVSYDQMAGCAPGVMFPAFTTYPEHAREPPERSVRVRQWRDAAG